MRQRIADALQLVGAGLFVVAGTTINWTVGLYSAGAAMVVAGVVMERS
jgi:hypothetical protein